MREPRVIKNVISLVNVCLLEFGYLRRLVGDEGKEVDYFGPPSLISKCNFYVQ